MRYALVLAVLLLSGCGGTTKYLVSLDIDEKLKEECSKDLPIQANSSDEASLEWASKMLVLYEKCANKQKAIVDLINKYNQKVVEDNRVKETK